MRGHFITIEGGEGAGKSSIIKVVESYLKSQGRSVVCTREPGGTPLAELMRELLLDARNKGLTQTAELLLMFAARSQNVEELIIPALESGADVICDRFTDASYAYQGGGRKMGFEAVSRLESLVHPGLQPDLTLLLDLPISQGMERASNRSEPDRFEKETLEFFKRVRDAYLQRAADDPDRFALIDASQPLEQVFAQVERVLETRL